MKYIEDPVKNQRLCFLQKYLTALNCYVFSQDTYKNVLTVHKNDTGSTL